MRVHLQRKRVFSAAHRYWNPAHDAGWNAERFGPYTEVHGHNYTVVVTLAGGVDPNSGIVVNLVDIKAWLAEAVAPFENRLIDSASPALSGLQPSTENLTRIIWNRMNARIAGQPCELTAVSVAETDDLRSEYRGEGNVVYVTRTYDFSAAHRLHSERLSDTENERVFGKCNRPGGHGHNYVVDVTLRGTVDPDTGFACPLDQLDRIVEERVLQPMDHRNLNTDVPQFAHRNPTSENLAVVIWEALLPEVGPALHKVRIEETPRNAFEYMGE